MKLNTTSGLMQGAGEAEVAKELLRNPVETPDLTFDDVKDSLKRNQVAANIYNTLAAPSFQEDPEFELTNDMWSELSEGIPQDYLDEFKDIKSYEHGKYIKQNLKTHLERREEFSKLGFKGAALDVTTSLVDPVAIAAAVAAGALTGGAGTLAIAGMKANRLRRIGVGFLAGSSLETALYSSVAYNNPDFDMEDAYIAALFGGTVSAGFAGYRSTEQVLSAEVARLNGDKTLLNSAFNRGEVSKEAFDKGLATLNGKLQKARGKLFGTTVNDNVDKVFGGKVRIDLAARLRNSDNELTRKFANLVDEPVGYASGKVVEQSAEKAKFLFRNPIMQGFANDLERNLGPLLDAGRDVKGIVGKGVATANRIVDPAKMQVEFLADVSKAIRRDAGEYVATLKNKSPEYRQAVENVANSTRQRYMDMLQQARALGIKGFDDIPEDIKFVPRLFSPSAVRAYITKTDSAVEQELRRGNLQQLFAQAILKGSPDLKPERVTAIANGFVRSIEGNFSPTEGAKKLRADLGDELRDRIKKEVPDILDEELDGILAGLTYKKKSPTEKGVTVQSAKRRVGMDETTRMQMLDGDEIGIEDFIENNAFTLLERYSTRLGGAVGLKQAGIDEDELMAAIYELGKDSTDGLRLQGAYNLLMGYSSEAQQFLGFANPKVQQTLRRLGKGAQLTYMGAVSIAQIPEFGMIAGTAGLKVFAKYIPEFRKFSKAAGAGRMDEDTFKILNRYLSLGTQHTMFNPATQLDEIGALDVGAFGRVDEALEKGTQAMYTFNGMHKLTGIMRQMAAATTTERFLKMAKVSSKNMKDKDWRILASAGISKADWNKLAPMLNSSKYIKKRKGFLGSDVIEDIDVDAMMAKNPELTHKYLTALSRTANKAVITEDFGSLPLIAQSGVGKMFLQFRRFMMMSWPKILVNGAYTRDTAEIATSFITSTFLASIAYTGQTYLNAIGDPDAEEYIDNRLNFDRGYGAFLATIVSRTGQGAVPMTIADTALTALGMEPLLGNSRSTGLSTSLLDFSSTPVGSYVTKGVGGVLDTAVGAVTLDQEQFGDGVDKLTDIAPLARLPILLNIYNGLDSLAAPE